MRLNKILFALISIPLLVSCSKEMSKDDASARLNKNTLEAATEKYGTTCKVDTKNELIKATGVFAEGGSQYEKVKKYISEEKSETANLSKYFVSASYLNRYDSKSYKYIKSSFKSSGSNGLTIKVDISDERNNDGIIVKMKESVYDSINDYGILLEEVGKLYFSWSGNQEGEFEYTYSSKITLTEVNNA